MTLGLSYRSDSKRAEAVVAEIKSLGRKAFALQSDVAREDEVVALFARVDKELGPLTALVNNAGITGRAARVQDVDAASVNEVLAANVTGSFICAREAVRRMSTRQGGRGGAIVNISSAASRHGSPGEYVHYAASKGAIDTFTVGLAKEVADDGIRVNAIRPGLIDTEIHASSGIPDRVARITPTIPLKRIGSADEVAARGSVAAVGRRVLRHGRDPGCVGGTVNFNSLPGSEWLLKRTRITPSGANAPTYFARDRRTAPN